ncbi:MAG: hypothetical protein PPFGHCPK_00070 [Spiroplasma endosymbiont of Drosophila atripex]|nr:MAG: hypothetical protein PPFGHCPK_00070 [Spiroplasma endosymbiont of Drosophila atripex]
MVKIIVANAQGDVKKRSINEQREFCHSQFTPTGFFVKEGAKITIKVLKNIESVFSIFIGQWGSYENLNNGEELSPKEYVINGENQTIISEIEGMLYLSNKSESTDYEVLIIADEYASRTRDEEFQQILNNNINSRFAEITIDKTIEVPTFIVRSTTNEEFKKMLEYDDSSPFVEIIGENVFGTFQMEVADNLWKYENPDNYTIISVFNFLDDVYEISSFVHGLSSVFDGAAQKFNNKIHITNPDTGVGYASATDYCITFQQDTGAGEALFKEEISTGGWYAMHEIGHTYQSLNYQWNGVSEVTNNIYALSVQRDLKFESRLITDNIGDEVKEFINLPDKDKNFDDIESPWVKLGMFWQLEQAFGETFYSMLNQSYRLLDSKLLPTNNKQKKQLFIWMASKVTKRDLSTFFVKWGIKLDEETEDEIRDYPSLKKKIWNNFFDDAIIEKELSFYTPVEGVKITGFLDKGVGDQISENDVKKNITMEDNFVVESIEGISYQNSFFLDKKIIDANFVVIDRNKDYFPNKYSIPVNLDIANSILLEGIGYDWGQYRAIINLNKTKKTFFIGGNNEKFHDNFKNKSYIKVTIKDNNGISIYEKTAEGQNTSLIFDDINKINYKNNYTLIFWFAEPKRGLYFDPTVGEWVPSKTKDVEFAVSDDKLIKNSIL